MLREHRAAPAVGRRAQPRAARAARAPPASARPSEGRGVQPLLHPVQGPRPRPVPGPDGEVRPVDLDARRSSSLWSIAVALDDRRLRRTTSGRSGPGRYELYAFLRKPSWTPSSSSSILCLIGVIHEYGHAYAIKFYGGEVHDIGAGAALLHARLLLRHDRRASLPEQVAPALGHARRDLHRGDHLLPSPRRSGSRPIRTRLLHELAYKTMLFTGVSTHLLQHQPAASRSTATTRSTSVLEIPELREESFRYLGALFQRHVLRLPVEVPVGLAPQAADLLDLRHAGARLTSSSSCVSSAGSSTTSIAKYFPNVADRPADPDALPALPEARAACVQRTAGSSTSTRRS